jgi:cytochrome c oxidase subunit II
VKLLPLIPEQASTLSYQFEYLFWYISIVCAVAGFAVYGFMLYCCIKYRRGATTGSTPRILGSHRLELAWTIIPAVVFFTFFGWGVAVFSYAVHAPADAEEIFVTGKQWMWKAEYKGGQQVIIGGNPRNMTEAERNSIGRLVIPVNRPVKISLMSEDVIHDFGVPAFRSKIDVLPKRYTTAWYHPTKIGEYHIYCDQYCGTWHSLMVGKIKVVSEQDYQDFLIGTKSLQGSPNPVDNSAAQRGRNEFLRLRCNECHTAKANAQAPVLEEIYGTTKKMLVLQPDGKYVLQDVTVDEGYILESIIDPRAKVGQQWSPVMPGEYHKNTTASERNALVQFIKSLKMGQTPDRTERTMSPIGSPNTTPPKTTGSPTPEKKP